MAQSRSRQGGGKKTTSGRASSGRARSSGSRAPSARSQKPASRRAQRRAQTPDLLPSVLLAGLGLLCVAMVLVPGQNIWRAMRGVYFGLFGVIAYLVGPFLLYLAYLLASGYRVGRFAGKVALMAALCAGMDLGVTDPGAIWALRPVLEGFDLPITIPCSRADAERAVALDKKGSGGEITLVLLREIGRAITRKIEKEEMLRLLDPLLEE